MQTSSFYKRIQGHELEFNKQYDAPKYEVSIKDVNLEGTFLTLEKDEKGFWTVAGNTTIPVWFNEISLDIHYAIEKNEGCTEQASSTVVEGDYNLKRAAPSFPVRLSCLY